MQNLKRLSVGWLPHRLAVLQSVVLLFAAFIVFTSSASAVIRFQNRSLFIFDPTPGVVTDYTISLTYTTATTVGSIDMLFCENPIPTEPCDVPTGLDVSGATLIDQTGETGYTIGYVDGNHIILTRTPGLVGNTPSTYKFSGIMNPTDMSHSFSIRLSDYASTDATGAIIDLGSVLSQTNIGVSIETQVPPMLIFCVATQVTPDCTSTTGGNYHDMGDLDPTKTIWAESQMAAGTNASSGYVITANGTTMQAGMNTIDALGSPTVSAPGNNQFGLNLRQNNVPGIGADPDGASTNTIIAPNYDTPDEYMFQDGDEVASAPNVSLLKRYTVSYILNVKPTIRAGVYTTTITYICTGRF